MKRVMVVDDSRFMRMALKRIIGGVEGLVVCGEAANGEEAVRLSRELRPDLITMDVNMPGIDGVEATRQILAQVRPPPKIVMVSALTREGTQASVEALRAGAVDVVPKGSDLMEEDIGKLHFTLEKVLLAHADTALTALSTPRFARDRPVEGSANGDWKALQSAGLPSRALPLEASQQTLCAPATPNQVGRSHAVVMPARPVDLILIGASTGGPKVLGLVLTRLPPEHPPVVIAQHLPAGFTQSLANSLAGELGRDVEEAGPRHLLRRESVVLIPGGIDGMVSVGAEGSLFLKLLRTESTIHPSVNLLFESSAIAARSPLAVILTGMGEDGAVGAAALRKRDAPVLVQTPASCAVAGMPEALIQRGLATAILSLDEIAEKLGQWSTWPLEGRSQPGFQS